MTATYTDEHYVQMARKFSLMSYGRGVYLIDTRSERFLYHTDHDLLLGRLAPEEFGGNCHHVFRSIIVQPEAEWLEQVVGSLVERLRGAQLEVLRQTVVCAHFHIRIQALPTMVQHKVVLLGCDEGARWPRYLLGEVSPSVSQKCQCYYGSPAGAFRSAWPKAEWVQLEKIGLSPQERTMLRLAIQGFSVEDSARLMCRSVDSVKHYRRRLFTKLGCTSMQQAVSIAATVGLV